MSNPRRDVIRVDWLGLWILFSAWCSISGWSLSAFGALNPIGVMVSFLIFAGAIFLLWRPLKMAEPVAGRRWYFLRTRRWLPRGWLVLAVLAGVGGALYVPNNYDYLSYRFPRVLDWCWEQKWYWIPTGNARMNYSGNQFEWMMVPSFVLFKSDRLFFLINFASYLFMPGLVFSVFRGLGISARISWWWMWVLPCGACYILQAGSVGNDSFAVVYLLASLHFLFRAGSSGAIKNLVFSTLAIALMTGAKASNLPLALPWTILLFLTRDRVFARAKPAAVATVLIAAAGASFLPLAVMNQIYAGDFFGDPNNTSQMRVQEPLGGIVGNAVLIAFENLSPPLWYKEILWNPDLPAIVTRNFPRLVMGVREIPNEEGAGVGLGCVISAVFFLVVGLWTRGAGRPFAPAPSRVGLWLMGGAAVAALVYMAKIASEAAPRLVAPYYAMLIGGALVLAALDGRVVRWRFFRVIGLLVMLSAFPMLILSPARPLFPVQVMAKVAPAGMQKRLQDVYTVYAARAFAFQPVFTVIPPGEMRIGILQNANALVASLWRPFGSHQVIDVYPHESAEAIRAQGIRWVVVSDDAIVMHSDTDLATVLANWSGHVVAEKQFSMTLHQGVEKWYIVNLDGR